MTTGLRAYSPVVCCSRLVSHTAERAEGVTKNIEHVALVGCHRFEYLTLLNTFPDATTRDRQGIDEYYLRDVVAPNPPKV